jgi:hypothetical protein
VRPLNEESEMNLPGKAIIAAVAALTMSAAGCTQERPRQNERWTTTEDTTVKIDWDKVNEAYKQAEGRQTSRPRSTRSMRATRSSASPCRITTPSPRW